MDPASTAVPTHPLVSLFAAAFWVILWLLDWARSIIAFVTIRVPIYVYAVLSYSLTLTLDFWTLLFLFAVSFISLSFYVRFKYLNPYEHLNEPPLLKPDAKELHPDVNTQYFDEGRGGGFHNYLDEFLMAIRVFGFLEKPVFHELARHLQTRRLIAGDTLSLDSDKSFYSVIDGTVQVFAHEASPTPLHYMHHTAGSSGNWDEEEMGIDGYQLLNEVGAGGTLSSLFTILSLFTEDVKISWDDQGQDRDEGPGMARRPSVSDANVPHLDLNREHDRTPSATAFLERTGSYTSMSPGQMPRMGENVFSLNFSGSATTPVSKSDASAGAESSRVLQGTIARATEDTTLAVIPAEAFRRVTKKFPKASAHIVQVILTRFSRVTFNAAHRYLGLTSELLRAEKAINDLACHPLPDGFYEGGGLSKLRQRFGIGNSFDGGEGEEEESMTEVETTEGEGEDGEEDYFMLKTRSKRRRRGTASSGTATGSAITSHLQSPGSKHLAFASSSSASSNGTGTGTYISRSLTASPLSTAPSNLPPQTPGPSFRHHASRDQVQAGDLHTTTANPQEMNVYSQFRRMNSVLRTPHPKSQSLSKAHKNPRGRKTVMISLEGTRLEGNTFGDGEGLETVGDTSMNLRDEVMACIARSIGLLQPTRSISTENSPVLRSVSTSGRGFNSSLGSLSMLEVGAGDDAISNDAASSNNMGDGKAHNLIGLNNEVEILYFPAGSTLVKAGESNAGLFYVIDGFLDISMPSDEDERSKDSHSSTERLAQARSGSTITLNAYSTSTESKTKPKRTSFSSAAAAAAARSKPQRQQKHLFTVKRGGIAGYLASLSGIPSYVDIRAKTDTYVGFLPAKSMNKLLQKRPIVLLTLSKRLLSLLSPLVLQIDSALDWVHVNAGQVLWRPGDISDSLYIVINGRLRALRNEDDDRVTIAGEYGQGATVGELDVITHAKRTSTVHAIRDTELARVPLTLFNAISRNPQATVHLLKLIASRVRDEMDVPNGSSSSRATDLSRKNFNLKTVALLPTSSNVPIAAFGKKLHAALEGIGAPTSYLNQASVMSHVGNLAFTRMGNLKVAGWLAEQEQLFRIVLYVADSPVGSQWTQTCIRQADYIMVVGLAEDPSIGDYEKLLLASKTTARKELVLLHPDRSVIPGSTRQWLKNRSWIHAHFHVELPGLPKPTSSAPPSDPAALVVIKKVKHRVEAQIEKYRGSHTSVPRLRPDHANDFARLARRLCGRTIGVVLGGGGARGMSHLGVLRALEDYGIPVDHIAGTSIGAFVGGLYAREGDVLACGGRSKAFAGRMSSIWRMLADVTYPIVAYTTGHAFNRAIYKAFYDLHIEDMWLPFFCNSTNILRSRMEIHETGYAWRYIRASMTLVGLLPPLSDHGNMLVDGGYIDNLPVATMLSLGAHAVFAVDVGSLDDNSPRDFGDTVSGWWLLLNRWNPFSRAKSVPPITEIQSRLAYVSSVKTLEDAKIMGGCLYMRMPVEEYGTLQWSKFTEIQQKGYEAALEMLAKWDQEHKLPSYSAMGDDVAVKAARKGRGQRRNSI